MTRLLNGRSLRAFMIGVDIAGGRGHIRGSQIDTSSQGCGIRYHGMLSHAYNAKSDS